MANFFDDPPPPALTGGGPDAAPALLQPGTYRWSDGSIADFPEPPKPSGSIPNAAVAQAPKPNFFDDAATSQSANTGFQWSPLSIPAIAQGAYNTGKRVLNIPNDVASGAIDLNNPAAAGYNAARMLDPATIATGISPGSVGTKMLGGSGADLLTAGKQGLNGWDQSPIMFGTGPVAVAAAKLKAALTNGKTFTEPVAPETHNALDQLINTPPNATGVPASSLNSARQLLSDIGQGDSRDASAARQTKRGLVEFMQGATPADLVAGAPALPAAKQALADGLANYAAGKRVQTLQGIEENTGLGAGSANSGKNIGNSERQRLKSLFQNPPSDPGAPSRAVTSGFSPDEIAQGKAIINPQGWSLPNSARTLGNALGGGGGLGKTIGMGTGGGIGLLVAPHLGISPEAGAAAGGAIAHGVGDVAKNFENAAVMRQAAALADKVGQRSPLFQSGQGPQGAVFPSATNALVRALMMRQQDQQQQP